MIEEVLAEIAAAEEKAAQIVADAQNEARTVSLSAATEADALRADYAIATKQAVQRILAEATEQAEREAQAAQKEAESEAQNAVRAAERNVRGAGEWLFDKLTRGKI